MEPKGMMIKCVMKAVFLSVILLMVSPLHADVIDVMPGKLSERIAGRDKNEASASLRGRIDARDFESLASLASTLKDLDMSGLYISESSLPAPDEWGREKYSEGELPPYFFFQSTLEKTVLPANLKIVPEGVFSYSSIKEVTLPENCISIGDYAFYGCGDLKKVIIGDKLKTIGAKAFGNCGSLKGLILPQRINLTGNEVFYMSGVTELDLTEAESLADYALANATELKTVRLNGQGKIGTGLLMGDSSLEYVLGNLEEVPDMFAAASGANHVYEPLSTAEYIGEYAFASGGVTDIVFSEDLTYISAGAFAGSKLKNIDANPLGRNVPEVEESAFEGLEPSEITVYVTNLGFVTWSSDPFWSRFNLVTGSSGVENNEVSNGMRIKVADRRLNIISESPIEEYAVLTINGMVLDQGKGNKEILEIDLSDYSGKMIMVKARNSEQEISKTFLLK